MLRKSFIVLFSIFWGANIAEARFATFTDAPAEYELNNVTVTVEKDNDIEYIEEFQIKILNEVGREAFGTQSFRYNSNISKIELIEAKTINDGVEYKIEASMIEDKPIASNVNGFDDIHQLQISLPKIAIGSSIYIKLKRKLFKSIFPGFYGDDFDFGSSIYTKNQKVKVKSKIKFNILTNDPGNNLNIAQETSGDWHILDISLKKPIYVSLVGEGESSLLDAQKTWVKISSLNSYEEYSKKMAPNFENVINASLPLIFGKIADEAAKINNEIDQINFVTSQLAKQIRYMGDWRTIDGKMYPRSFDVVVASGYGDCKDFSSLTVAMLRNLGYKANVAFIYRGEGYLYEDFKIVDISNINHAMTRVIGKSGTVYWIDPTNFVSMAGGIFPDIADRPALIIDSVKPEYLMTPPIDHKYSRIESTKIINFPSENISAISGKVTLIGESAYWLTGLAQSRSIQTIEDELMAMVSGELTPLNKQVKLPDLTSRVVKDITVDYSFELDNQNLETNLGRAYVMTYPWAANYIYTADDQLGTIYMGSTRTLSNQVTLKNIKVVNISSLNAEVKSPWLIAKRDCKLQNQDIICSQTTEVLKSFITGDEIRSKEYRAVKSLLKKYFNQIAIIYTKAAGAKK